MTELEALLILNAINGLGPNRIKTLIECFGSAKEVCFLKKGCFSSSLGIPLKVIENILHFPQDEFLKKELALIKNDGIRVLSYSDEAYPKRLLEIHDAPVILYFQGENLHLNSPAVAIVGSRRATLYGTTLAEQFSQRLAELGIVIVSGMARGIDTAAHKGALKAGGFTIAVLGCGLEHTYPPENKTLMKKITEKGAVISEFPMQTPPATFNFPRRNRIISGLSLGVVIVEAALKSGALITADCALEQGREVFAIPGKIDSPMSQGVHRLIKQGAKLVTCLEDILEELKPHLESSDKMQGTILKEEFGKDMVHPPTQETPSEFLGEGDFQLTQSEQLIYQSMGNSPVHVDELASHCGLQGVSLSTGLFRLELKKIIRQLPGKMFVRF